MPELSTPYITSACVSQRSVTVLTKSSRRFLTRDDEETEQLRQDYYHHYHHQLVDMAFQTNFGDALVAFGEPPVYYPDHGMDNIRIACACG